VTFWLLSSSSSYYIFLACLMFDNWCSAFMHAWMEKHGVVQWILTCLSTCPCLCKAQHDHGMKRMVAAQVDQLFSPTFCIKKKWTNCFTLSLHRAPASCEFLGGSQILFLQNFHLFVRKRKIHNQASTSLRMVVRHLKHVQAY
jgi:hypothetical protein